LIIGGGRVRTATRLTSLNPACPSQIVGVHAEATRRPPIAPSSGIRCIRSLAICARSDERAGLLLRVAAELRARRLELSAWLIFEVGKNWREADAEVAEAIDFLEFYAREAIRLADSAPPIQFPASATSSPTFPSASAPSSRRGISARDPRRPDDGRDRVRQHRRREAVAGSTDNRRQSSWRFSSGAICRPEW
jgi:hypothetical protein